MRPAILIAALLATVSASSAFASCHIYAEPSHTYAGDMILTGTHRYAGNMPGANDGTPYAGSLNEKGEVFLGEKNPSKFGEVKGNELYNIYGQLVGTFANNEVKNRFGQVVATTYAPYDDGHVCEAAAGLAGAAMFIGL